MTDETRVVGEIRPGDDGKPMWRVVRNEWELRDAPANTRPCPHEHITIDEKFQTVTCSKCNERIEPFVALKLITNWGDNIERHRISALQAERSLHRAELKRLRGLKACTSEQAREIDEMLRTEGKHTPGAMRQLASKVKREQFAVRQAKRAQRRRA